MTVSSVTKPQLSLIAAGTQDPVRALSVARGLLDEVRAGRRGAALRIYRPQPTAAFGARDRFSPGFNEAVAAARKHGFTPVLRSLGGRVAAYHEQSLVIDHLEPANELYGRTQERFEQFSTLYRDALRSLGVDARIGEIPGEYCPGEHSVNIAGRIKAIGTAQRVTNAGWLFSSSIIIADPHPIRAVLTDVEAALGVEWDPATGGAISELCPDITVAQVRSAILERYRQHWEVVPGELAAQTVESAAAYDERHRL